MRHVRAKRAAPAWVFRSRSISWKRTAADLWVESDDGRGVQVLIFHAGGELNPQAQRVSSNIYLPFKPCNLPGTIL